MEPLIALCASHIDSERRLRHFRNMLESWKEQTINIPLYVSLSTEPMWNRLVLKRSLEATYPGLQVFTRSRKHSQFSHYKALTDELYDECPEAWVIFTDDDDLWHPLRALSYAGSLLQLLGKEELNTTTDIRTPAAHSFQRGLHADVQRWDQVDDLQIKAEGDRNYIQQCCRFFHLKQFVDHCSQDLLNFPYCDVRFMTFVTGASSFSHVKTSPHPLYFWRDDLDTQHNRELTDSSEPWEETTVQANAKLLMCACPNITIQEMIQKLLEVQIAAEPTSIPTETLPEASLRLLTVVMRRWKDPDWVEIRDFPSLTMPHV